MPAQAWGAVLCAALIPTSMTAVPVAAFLGALGACMLVYTLARRTGASRITLVLAGVAISSMLSAAIDAVSILFPEAALGAGSFMVGRLSGVTVAALKVPALLSLLAGAGAFAMSYELDLLTLGMRWPSPWGCLPGRPGTSCLPWRRCCAARR